MNLVWLKYVSYALVGCAIALYFAMRLNKTRLSQTAKAALFAACIVLACVLWHVQERNSDLHSPRQLVIGTVASVTRNTHKSGSFTDSFRLRLGTGATSQEFTTTDTVGSAREPQPIHPGDVLGVLYRTWDDVPLTIDEIEGQNAGWHYQRFAGALSVFVWTVAIVGGFALLGALAASARSGRRKKPAQGTLDQAD